jgi:small subunit ribosomal protein S14
MAKKCSINRNEKRIKLAKSQSNKRSKLKALIMNQDLPIEDRFAASLKLAQLPRNGAETRVRNRCALTGRSRGFFRKFKLSRNALRKLASNGQLPGVTKSSW